jgi:cytochrome bd ubiquinol oxidase subunit II
VKDTVMTIPVHYETLRLIWWLFLGVLLIGFAIMDGFDLGVAALLPYVARTDTERRVAINTIGPVWDGNQVWLILGGGAVFAAWPMIYAASFSGFYIAMFLVIAALILRPVGFEFRNKIADPRWRAFWDYALFVGGVVPSIVFGVAVGNLLQGVPFRIDADLRVLYEGSGLFELLNPFGLLCGLVSAAMLTAHGAIYLTVKADGMVKTRTADYVRIGVLVTVGLFVLAGLWVSFGLDGYAVTSALVSDGPSNPLLKTVVRQPGQWLANYKAHHWMIAAPVLGIAGPLLALWLTQARRAGLAFVASGSGILGIISTAGS